MVVGLRLDDAADGGPGHGGPLLGAERLAHPHQRSRLLGVDSRQGDKRLVGGGVDIEAAEVVLTGVGGQGVDDLGPVRGVHVEEPQHPEDLGVVLEGRAALEHPPQDLGGAGAEPLVQTTAQLLRPGHVEVDPALAVLLQRRLAAVDGHHVRQAAGALVAVQGGRPLGQDARLEGIVLDGQLVDRPVHRLRREARHIEQLCDRAEPTAGVVLAKGNHRLRRYRIEQAGTPEHLGVDVVEVEPAGLGHQALAPRRDRQEADHAEPRLGFIDGVLGADLRQLAVENPVALIVEGAHDRLHTRPGQRSRLDRPRGAGGARGFGLSHEQEARRHQQGRGNHHQDGDQDERSTPATDHDGPPPPELAPPASWGSVSSAGSSGAASGTMMTRMRAGLG